MGGWAKLTVVYLAMSDSEGGVTHPMPTPLIYEPSGTESESSSEHSTSSDDSEDRLSDMSW